TGRNIQVENSKFGNIYGVAPEAGIDLENNLSDIGIDGLELMENVRFSNCDFYSSNRGLLIYPNSAKMKNIKVENCNFFDNIKDIEVNGAGQGEVEGLSVTNTKGNNFHFGHFNI